jgi:hypothetical protein
LAGQLARLHLDRLLHVLTRIERGHKLLQRWRWSCGFMIGRCLILGGGWEREGLKTGKERTSSFAGGGQEGRQEACTWLRKDTERLLGRVYLCARVACRSLFHPPSLRPLRPGQQCSPSLVPHSSSSSSSRGYTLIHHSLLLLLLTPPPSLLPSLSQAVAVMPSSYPPLLQQEQQHQHQHQHQHQQQQRVLPACPPPSSRH